MALQLYQAAVAIVAKHGDGGSFLEPFLHRVDRDGYVMAGACDGAQKPVGGEALGVTRAEARDVRLAEPDEHAGFVLRPAADDFAHVARE